MPTVHYARVQQGYRPFTNPRPLAGLRGLGEVGMGDPNCSAGMPYDMNGDLCPGVDPNCAVDMPYDVHGNPCPGTPVQPSGTGAPPSPSPVVTAPLPTGPSAPPALAPQGSYLNYQGTWTTSTTKSANDILQAVIASLPSQGLRVVNSSTTAGLLANTKLIGLAEAGQSFNVTLQLQVTGPGFAQAGDAGSIVDHYVYATTGMMPTASYTSVAGGGPGGAPPGMPNQSFTSWLEQNALYIGLGIAAAFVLPKVL